MATIIFVCVIYITLGTIVITWDEWRRNRNEEREIKEYMATRGRTTAGVVNKQSGELNREKRRMERKREAQDKRDKKRFGLK